MVATFLATVLLPFAAVAAGVDQGVAAADDTLSADEPVLRWWDGAKRKVFRPPDGETPPFYARLEAPDADEFFTVSFTTEAIGTRLQPDKSHTLYKDEWTDVSPHLHYGYREVFFAKADGDGDPPPFSVSFSKSPDGSEPLGTFASGGGRIVCGMVSLAKGYAASDVEMSGRDLLRARKGCSNPPPRPKTFPVSMVNKVAPDVCTPAAFSNELEVLRLFGVNDTGFATAEILDPSREFEPRILPRNPPGDFLATTVRGCICSPDWPAITNRLKKLKSLCEGPLSRGKTVRIDILDEPHWGLPMLTNCKSRVKSCRERFGRDFTFDPADGRGEYLATLAFRDETVLGFCKGLQDAARAVDTNILVTANIGIGLVFGGNAVLSDPGPFAFAKSGAFGIGQTEDWCNCQITRQFNSYVCDFYRAAYSRHGMDFMICSVMMSAPETAAKAFSELGHGAAALHFFNYGPHWLSGDYRNDRPRLHEAVRLFTSAVAEAEDAIAGANVARGDAAILYSETNDRLELAPGMSRDWMERNPDGKERMATSLMLAHCGVRTDILPEDGLAESLAKYRVLFATDGCVRRDCAAAIARWLRDGGVLVKTRGALERDEDGKPLPNMAPGRRGAVLEMDFSPWRDYVKTARQTGDCYSHREFDAAVRGRMADIVRRAGIVRRVRTNYPLVEASLLEKDGRLAVVLANWSADERRRVTVTMENPPPAAGVRSASGAKLSLSRSARGALAVSGEIGWGDIFIFERKP